MNFRRVTKPIAAILLAVGIFSVGITAPADAATTSTYSTNDTGWDKR